MVSEINLTPTGSLIEIPAPPNVDGNEHGVIPARTWGTPGECMAGAVLVHGLGAHSGWFEALGRRLKVKRIFALAYDQVGFGKRRSEQFTSQNQWYDDLTTCYEHLKTNLGDKPIYVMGNSMGAAVCLKVVADRLIAPKGLVLFSPGFNGNPKIFSLAYRISAIVRALLQPESEIAVPYTPDMVTTSESIRLWMERDPDRRFSPTGRMLLGVLKLSLSFNKINSISCPLFMLSPEVDKIADGKMAQSIYKKLRCPSKKQHRFERAGHDLMFDPVLDEVVEEVVRWITDGSDSVSYSAHGNSRSQIGNKQG